METATAKGRTNAAMQLAANQKRNRLSICTTGGRCWRQRLLVRRSAPGSWPASAGGTQTPPSSGPAHQEGEPRRREGAASFRHEYEIGVCRALALEPPQIPQFVPLERMDGWGAPRDPPDVEAGLVEIDLGPTQISEARKPCL